VGQDKFQESLLLAIELSTDGHLCPSSAFCAGEWRQGVRNAGEESFDHTLRTAESLKDKLEYIRQNPVRRGLVARPED
jgi:hypothetical protein